MKVVYATTKTIQIKAYTVLSSNQLGLEVERPKRSLLMGRTESNQTNKTRAENYILIFSLFYTIEEIFLFFMRFFQPPYTNPAALFMVFPKEKKT